MAFVDARTLSKGARIEADVCVIGTGAAGLAIARHFLDRSRRVVLLESGGMASEPEIQALYRGRIVGQSHAPLDTCRLRFFGGTTNHWTAHVRRLEPIDFERRPWVPHSGWPVGLAELAPYYERVARLLRIPEGTFEVPEQRRRRLSLGSDRVTALLRYIVPESDRRLGKILRDRVAKSSNVDTYLYANVLGIDLDESRKRVRQLRIGTLSGFRVTAQARSYVLAAGGIENPRILLLSSIGAGGDALSGRVGAFYANHPAGWGGYIQPIRRRLDPTLFGPLRGPRGPTRPHLRLTDETQRRLELLNCWIGILGRARPTTVFRGLQSESTTPLTGPAVAELGFADGDVANLAGDVEALGAGPGRKPTARRAPPMAAALRVLAEPSPNPSSVVRLDDELDAFGQRRAQLDWRLAELDSESARTSLRVFAQEIAAAGVGRVRVLFPGGGFESVRTVASHHHMGTTRMSVEPNEGVVDPNCRVHGIANLYVAGSSVFPTYGTANPTYTLLALAFRLAEHLQKELSG